MPADSIYKSFNEFIFSNDIKILGNNYKIIIKIAKRLLYYI